MFLFAIEDIAMLKQVLNLYSVNLELKSFSSSINSRDKFSLLLLHNIIIEDF
jgi:hypothetical protein